MLELLIRSTTESTVSMAETASSVIERISLIWVVISPVADCV